VNDFPADVRQFIDQNIESLAQLEALLLLRKDPQRSWNAEEMAKALYVPVEMAQTLLAEFGRRQLTKIVPPSDVQHSYNVVDAKLDELIGRVATEYQERRVGVISLIYSKPLNKVQTFADAFRLRKETPP
jgi:hypothetical protein